MTAAVGGEGDPPALRPPVREQAHGDVHDLLRRGHQLDAGTNAGSADRSEVTRERTGVRAGRARAHLGGAAGQEHDRRTCLDCGLAGARELTAVAEVLEVDSDQPGGLVRGERLDQLGRLHVRLVPQRNEAREAEPELGPDHADLEREVAALRDETDRPGLQLLRAELELGAGVVDTEAIGPDQDSAGAADSLDDRTLARRPLVAHLAEAGADQDDAFRAGVERSVDCLLHPGGGDGDDDELRCLGELGQRRVRLAAEDLAALAVDEEDRTTSLALDRAAGEPEAPLAGDRRRAEHCDRPGVEEGREVAAHRRRFREMIRRWMSDVPSSISSSLASRIHFSTGYSRE